MKISNQLRVSAFLISAVALVTLIGPYLADWNETHIYNPRWTPHAKFHNAQTMLLGTLLALSTLWYTWKPAINIPVRINNLNAAIVFASLYWITQSLSILFPGTDFTDPEFGEIPRFIGIPGQLLIDIPMFILLLIALYLTNKNSSQNAYAAEIG